jgi:sensor domain CHASE-containing protein
MTNILIGILIGAVGIIVIAVLIWKNNKKKFQAAINEAMSGPGTPEEKFKKLMAIIKG